MRRNCMITKRLFLLLTCSTRWVEASLMSVPDSWCLLTIAVVSYLKSQLVKCSSWWRSDATGPPDSCPAHHPCMLVGDSSSAMVHQLMSVGYVTLCPFTGGLLWTHSLHLLPACGRVYADSVCDHPRPRLQLSHLACCDVRDRGSLSTNGERTWWRL